MYLHMKIRFVALVQQQATGVTQGEFTDLADVKLYRHHQSGGHGQREEDSGVGVGGLFKVCNDKYEP